MRFILPRNVIETEYAKFRTSILCSVEKFDHPPPLTYGSIARVVIKPVHSFQLRAT